MDTKPLLDFFADIPSASQIENLKKSLETKIEQVGGQMTLKNAPTDETLLTKLAELEAKMYQLQQQNDDLNLLIENCIKVLQNQTEILAGMAKILNERYDDTLDAIRDCNNRIDLLRESIVNAEPQSSVKPAAPVEHTEYTSPIKRTEYTHPEEHIDTRPEEHKERVVSEKPTAPKEPQTVEVKPEQAPIPEPPHTPETAPVQTLADSIHVEESLADRLSKTVSHDTLASTLNSSHIDSIKSAITIADRFRFQRELFAGNGALMSSTIDDLDHLNTMAEATEYIAQNFKWNADAQAVQDFMAIVARRY